MIPQKPYGKGSDTRKWIEERFKKCECMQFMQDHYDQNKCGCGRDKNAHDPMPYWPVGNWSWRKNTVSYPTDSYGTLEFGTGVKAQYIRMSPRAKYDDAIQLLTNVWGVEPPKLLISVHGGMSNFDLQPRLKRAFRRSLQRMAAVPGVWIITTGLNVGVVKHIGDALTAGVLRRHRAVVIGVAPWGVLANRHRLSVTNGEVRYYPPPTAPATTVLNPNHSFFFLIDDGTAGKYGAEAKWRRNFEKAITSSAVAQNLPLVALFVEGGANCIRSAVDYLTDSKPVVLVEGSGRAADILSFACRQIEMDSTMGLPSSGVFGEGEKAILSAIQRAFGVSANRNKLTLNEVILCTKRRELVSIWHPLGATTVTGSTHLSEDLDLCVLSSLLKAQRRSAPDQLRLALAWNRVDLAINQIFDENGQTKMDWPEGALNDAMIEALLMDRVEFVSLLLDHGVNMTELLTASKLEQLYNIKHSDTWLMRHIAKILINRQNNVRISLTDVANIVDSLMGYGYRSSYHQKVAQVRVDSVQKAITADQERFKFPFSELFIWAVLLRRQRMARLMWRLGEETLAKALVACRLYRSIASFVVGDVNSEIVEQLKKFGQEFADMAVDLLDRCHHLDEVTAQQLLTYELRNFSNKTCLALAVNGQQKQFVAHTCCQNLLSALWMGGLRARSSRPWKIVLAILLPPYALFGLDFLTQEELRLQPQTEQELEEQRLNEEDDSNSGDVSPTAVNVEDNPVNMSHRYSRLHREPHSFRMRMRRPSSHDFIQSTADPCKMEELELDPTCTLSLETHLATTPMVYTQSQILSPIGRSLFTDLETDSGRPLNIKTRFSEFYNAPVTKFWLHTIGYIMFIACFAYTILTRQNLYTAQWPEVWITLYVVTLLADKFREVFSIDARGAMARLNIYFLDLWNIFDAIAIVLFSIGFVFRWLPLFYEFGRALWIVAMIFFLIHIFDIFQANEDLATYITILHKMLKRMISFLIILGVVVATYGIILQATRYPYRTPEWSILKDIFVEPYFNLYGEVYHEFIDTGSCDANSRNSTDPASPPCWCCTWLGPLAQTFYLIVANILMLNLLIAVFNNVFESVNRVSQTLTKFQRYRLIVDYQLLPVLPPPFIAICHLYMLFRLFFRRCRGKVNHARDPGLLKLVLSDADEEQIHDFEEQARDELLEQRDAATRTSSDEQLRLTTERTEAMQLTIEQIVQRQAATLSLLGELELCVKTFANATSMPSPSRPIPSVSLPQTVFHPMMSINTNLQKLIAADDAAAKLFSDDGPRPRSNSPREVTVSPRFDTEEDLKLKEVGDMATDDNGHVVVEPSRENLADSQVTLRPGTLELPAVGDEKKVSPSSEEHLPSTSAEESSTRAIGPDIYRRLRELSSSGDDSEYCRTARTLIAQHQLAGVAAELEEEDSEAPTRESVASTKDQEELWMDPPES